jgi:hypothetical protein
VISPDQILLAGRRIDLTILALGATPASNLFISTTANATSEQATAAAPTTARRRTMGRGEWPSVEVAPAGGVPSGTRRLSRHASSSAR